MRPLIIMHGENIDWCHTVIRMLMYLVGVAVLALGMSLQTASGLGVAALTCFATTLSMLTGKTLGFWITATAGALSGHEKAVAPLGGKDRKQGSIPPDGAAAVLMARFLSMWLNWARLPAE